MGTRSNWEREHRTANKEKNRVDFKIEIASTSAAVEVKTAHCGYDKNGKLWKPCDYGKGECYKGVCQLKAFPPPRYLLVFAWPGVGENDPKKVDWDEMLEAYAARLSSNDISFVRHESSPDGGLSIGIFQIS